MEGKQNEELKAALEALKLKRYEEAYEIFSRIIGKLEEDKGENFWSEIEIANIYASRAISLIESDEREVYRNPDLFNEAMDDLEFALDLDNDNLDYQMIRGRLWTNCLFENYDQEALEIFRKIYQKQPEKIEAILFLGQLHYKRNEFEQAIRYFSLALEKLEEPDIFELRALSNYRKFPSDYRASINDFKKALQLAPDKYEYYIWLAECYQELGEIEDALEMYDELIDLQPDQSGYYVDRGTLLMASDPEAAFEDFNQAVSIDQNPMGLNNRAFYYKEKGMFAEAEEDAKAALKKDPKQTIAYATLAEIYADWGKENLFYKYLQQAAKYYYEDVVDLLSNPSFGKYKKTEEFKAVVSKFSS